MKKNLTSIIILLAVFVWGCKQGDESAAKKETAQTAATVTLSDSSVKETGIETAEASLTSISGYVSAPARIIANPDEEAVIGSLVKGRVKKVFVNPGSQVKAGQALMELEGLEIGEIKSAYRKAKAQLDFAEQAYKRQKTLNEQNVTASKNLIESKAEFDKAQAEFKAEDEKIHSIGLTDEEAVDNKSEHSSGKLVVKSPISGIVAERNVIIGQMVDESTTAFKIMNIADVIAEAQIYEKDIPKLAGSPAATFATSVYPGAEFKGKVTFISQTVDEKTRTIFVRASIPNAGGKLKPEMFGELKIPVTQSVKTIVVPADAVINDNGNYYVFIRKEGNTFEKKDVKLGIKDGNNVEITDGIKVKDNVVVKGAFYLKSELLKSSFGEEE